MTRNLLFHVYPKRRTLWRWHVEQLVRHRAVWNGRRHVVIVLDDHTESRKDIELAFEPLGAELHFRRNDPELGEVAYFIEMLGLLESQDQNEATFYAHAKGVTRDTMLNAIQMWSLAMYDLNLTFPGIIDKRLKTAATVGAFRVQIPHSGATWCFAGTFFWLKHSELFSRTWTKIERERYGVEGYPGRHFKFEQSSSLTVNPIPDREMPEWLYGRNSFSGVTEKGLKRLLEQLEKENGCIQA